MKEIMGKEISFVTIEPNINLEEFNQREQHSKILTKKQFSTKRRNSIYSPVTLKIKDKEYSIQMNYCTNPLCKWYGSEQAKSNEKGKPQKYHFNASGYDKSILCSDVAIPSKKDTPVITTGGGSSVYSNWAIATEIKRLIDQNTLIEEVYNFHKDSCEYKKVQPSKKNIINTSKNISRKTGGLFYSEPQGSGSIKYRCVQCKKTCTVSPKNKDNFTYKQRTSINDMIRMYISDHFKMYN